MCFLSSVFSILIIEFNPAIIFGLICALVVVLVMFRYPEVGTLVVIFVIYTNIPVIAKQMYGVPQVLASSVILFLAIPIIHYVYLKKENLVIDNTFMIMVGFLIVSICSSFFSKDTDVSLGWIIVFIQEGLVLYFLVTNAIRSLSTLKRTIWALILAGSLLGGVSLYQELMQSYDNQFGGLARKSADKIERWETRKSDYAYGRTGLVANRSKVSGINRAEGPMEEPNRFAQTMLVLLPLGCFTFWRERRRWRRLGAIVATSLILCGVLLSYSRGALITLALLLVLATCLRYIRLYQILAGVLALFLIITVAAPGFFSRLDSIRGVEGLYSEEAEVSPDGAVRGRMTEMLAALKVFVDHPILGVGPGQYMPFYSMQYHLDLENAFRYLPRARRAHSLYLELAAEVGIIGLATFMFAVCLVIVRLWDIRRRAMYVRSDLANMATALILSFIAYLGTAMFLHLAYQRYYWLLLAIGGSALRVLHDELLLGDSFIEESVEVANDTQYDMAL